MGPSGVVKNVELDPKAMRLPSEDLAASIGGYDISQQIEQRLETVRAALRSAR